MNKKLILLVSVVVVILISPVAVAKKSKLLREGFVVSGIEGQLLKADANDKWFFKFDSEVRDDKGLVREGNSLKLLPSAGLEKMLAQSAAKSHKSFRLWAIIIKYQNENYLFPNYALGISEAATEPNDANDKDVSLRINDANDIIKIPDDILAKFNTRKVLRPQQLKKGMKLKEDSILVDRTGFIRKQPDGNFVFSLDAVGRNMQRFSINLLPCEILERAQSKQADELENLRFKVAGIITSYKGQLYMLLQRARRVYSYQNFPQ